MKKRFLLVILSILIVVMGIPSYAAETPIKVEVDGEILDFDVPPQMVEGRTLVPFRGIFEALGADVDWDSTSKTAIGIRGSITIKLPIGKPIVFVNSKQIELDVPATIIGGRTFVPVRFIAESLGAMVDWDGKTKTVMIKEMGEKKYVDNYSTFVAGCEGLYTGEIQNEKANGTGTIQFLGANNENASKYKGQFRNGKLVGEGVFDWQNGDQYIGEFLNDNKHGEGTKTWANGDKYVGPWKDDVRSGQGTMTWANGDKYVGAWENDQANGEGTKTWANGDKYVGAWKDDARSGQGTMTWANGDQYIGEWKEDKANGQGIKTWANSDKYKGAWESGLRHGRGTLTSDDGKVLSGVWENDVLVGNDDKWKVN